MPILVSYPTTWYNFNTKKSHNRGYLQVYKGKKRMYMKVFDKNKYVYLPIGILDFIIKEIKGHTHVVCNKQQKDKLLMDFEHGLDNYFKFQRFKWEKSPTGLSQHYSDKYLRWMYKHRKEEMTEAERKELSWRLKNKRMKL